MIDNLLFGQKNMTTLDNSCTTTFRIKTVSLSTFGKLTLSMTRQQIDTKHNKTQQKTVSLMTVSIMTLSILALSLSMTKKPNDTWHTSTQHNETAY
jgi:hypothetical protein